MNSATKLFENKAVTIKQSGVVISIGCNSVKDAELLHEWLQSLSVPQVIKKAIQHIDGMRQRDKRVCLNCHINLRQLTDKQRKQVYEYYCELLGQEKVKYQSINKKEYMVFQ